jgi:hypothetical protein
MFHHAFALPRRLFASIPREFHAYDRGELFYVLFFASYYILGVLLLFVKRFIRSGCVYLIIVTPRRAHIVGGEELFLPRDAFASACVRSRSTFAKLILVAV